MDIEKLLVSLGKKGVVVQGLMSSLTGATNRKKPKATELSFLTDQVTVSEIVRHDMPKIGIVIWIPRELLPKREV